MEGSIKCGGCGVDNASDSRFCRACGQDLGGARSCAQCQAELDEDARFCRLCGTPAAGVAPAAQAAAPGVVVQPPELQPAGYEGPAPGQSRGALGVGLAVCAAAFVFLMVGSSNKPSKAPASGPYQAQPAPAASARPVATPPAAQPAQGAGPASAPAEAGQGGGAPISGTIRVAEALKAAAPSGGTFYVIARPGAMAAGPPLAAVRIGASANPTPYSIGPEDAMMGGPFNQPVTISVRWDQDGDPMTKQPGDLVGVVANAPIAPGTTGADVVLDKKL